VTRAGKSLGRWGEGLAAELLQGKGYEIVARNWRCAHGEIDIIAREGEELIFVEVKTRRGTVMGSPEEGLTPRKAGRVVELAQAYLAEADLDADWRVDLIAVELDAQGKLIRCEHIPNAILGW
jgi:putative endonuclease